jgi:hypothetical protein
MHVVGVDGILVRILNTYYLYFQSEHPTYSLNIQMDDASVHLESAVLRFMTSE